MPKEMIFNENMLLVTKISLAHSQLLLVQAFILRVTTVKMSEKMKNTMNSLALVLGLDLMNKDLGDFRSFLTEEQCDWIIPLLKKHSNLLKPMFITLTDGFKLTDFELDSTIGSFDGNLYGRILESIEKEPLNQSHTGESYDKYLKSILKMYASSNV